MLKYTVITNGLKLPCFTTLLRCFAIFKSEINQPALDPLPFTGIARLSAREDAHPTRTAHPGRSRNWPLLSSPGCPISQLPWESQGAGQAKAMQGRGWQKEMPKTELILWPNPPVRLQDPGHPREHPMGCTMGEQLGASLCLHPTSALTSTWAPRAPPCSRSQLPPPRSRASAPERRAEHDLLVRGIGVGNVSPGPWRRPGHPFTPGQQMWPVVFCKGPRRQS